MAGRRIEYNIVGRYVNENNARDIIGYHIESIDKNKSMKCSIEQIAFLVGKGQILNCTAQLYKDKILFRGNGISLDSLPIQKIHVESKSKTYNKSSEIQQKPRTVEQKLIENKQLNSSNNTGINNRGIQNNIDLFNKYYNNTVSKLLLKQIQPNNLMDSYDNIISELESKYSNAAYNLDDYWNFENDILDIRINIDGKQGNMYYISLNKWGFNYNTMVSEEREKLIISESTLYLLDNSFKDYIVKLGFKDDAKKYKRAHYHQVIIRLRAFKHIVEYKWLKIQYLKANNKYFESRLDKQLVVCIGNYANSAKNRLAQDLVDVIAFNSRARKIIMFNNDNISLQSRHISKEDYLTLIHEMCHSYTDVIYGTNWEANREDWGDKVWGLEESYGKQLKCHGRKFGNVVKLISIRTGLAFNDIMGYGLRTYQSDTLKSEIIQLYNQATFVRGHRDSYDNWYKNNKYTFINILDQQLDQILTNTNCNSTVSIDNTVQYKAQRRSYFDNTKNDLIDSYDIIYPPFIVDITDNKSFNERYRIMITDKNKKDQSVCIKLKVYRDYKNNMGYLVGEVEVNLEDNNINKYVSSISKLINKDIQSV